MGATVTSRSVTLRRAAVAASALALTACGGEPDAAGSGPVPDAPGTTVEVAASEFALDVAETSFAPAQYTFVMDNAGDLPHAITIDGPGVEQETSETVGGGERTELTVTLQKGEYVMWCPVGSHRSQGMETTFTVG